MTPILARTMADRDHECQGLRFVQSSAEERLRELTAPDAGRYASLWENQWTTAVAEPRTWSEIADDIVRAYETGSR